MFQKVLATFGSGGAKIDARLLDRTATPGRPLHGEVLLAGGDVDQEIKGLAVTLLARVQVPGAGKTEDLPFGTQHLVGREVIRAGQQVRVPFEVPLPWETPVTSVYGKPLTGMAVGVRAELDLAAAVSDPFDADAVAIEPLPAQKRVLDALSRIGFTFREAILEHGRIKGAQQQLPFFQEVRFTPSPRFASVFSQLAVTFLASSDRTDVVLEVTKRVRVSKTGGFGGRGQDFLGMFTMKPDVNWEKQLDDWLDLLARPRGIFD